jgi:hypothetical protein
MTPQQVAAVAKLFSRLFRVFGRLTFLLRLRDFLLHGGRESRAATLSAAAKVLAEMEQVKISKVKRLEEIIAMMQAAGFTPEQIQRTVLKEDEMNKVSDALGTLLSYIESGKISVVVVEDKRPGIDLESPPEAPARLQ